MRNLVFVALLATAALSMGCNGIHKRGCGCKNGGCGGQAASYGGGQGGCPNCGPQGGAGYAQDGQGGYGQDGYSQAGYGGDAYAGAGGAGGCGPGGCGPNGAGRGMAGVPHHFSREYNGPPGPSAAQVAYPYYTTRGPRDYFANNPPSIGY